ncbi:NAD(P)H-binding protein [Dactylosporangium siamense]|uniref:NAD(P)-dependent oxidoreductase n=2 Tax=Dactylosporangium siamense TaxID=685454 RepID=A0A919PRF1_9ACTN|nr:NAD(P)-dependent oxidoreductase [Dactylosporangium siamense]
MAVLLIGATGNVGPHVARALLRRGDDLVRVLTRDAGRAAHVLPPGCQVVEGDPGDDDTVVAAATGVDTVFLLTAHDHAMSDLQLRIIRALRRLPARFVKLSGTSTAINPDGPYTCRQHWEVEQVLINSGQPFTIVRPNAFMQTLIGTIMLPALRATGRIPNAIGDAGISLIDARDIGDACAVLLTEDRWTGQTVVLTGARAVTYREIAGVLGAETVDITPADVRDSLLHRGMPRWEAEHFQEMYQLFRDRQSEFVTPDVEHVLGRPPRAVEEYLHEVLTTA